MVTSSVLADLSAVFSQFNDPRKKRVVRYPSQVVVALVFLGLLGRITELAVLVCWAEAHWKDLRNPLGFTRKTALRHYHLPNTRHTFAGQVPAGVFDLASHGTGRSPGKLDDGQPT